jgi:TonB family protein
MKASWIAIPLALLIVCGCSRKEQPAAAASPVAEKVQAPQTPPPSQPAAAPKPPAPATSAPAPQKAQFPTAEAPDDATKPKLDYFPKPIFPSALLDRCIEGEVQVSMRVTPEGKAEAMQVEQSTDPAFSQALLTVLPLWRFIPAHKDGVAVARTVKIAIPFVINARPVDLPESVSHGQPELVGVTRPPHTGKGAAQVQVRFTLTSDTIVTNVEIVKVEGNIDEKTLIDCLSQWVFMPSRLSKNTATIDHVTAQITFTSSNNVLIQYPFPAPPAQ